MDAILESKAHSWGSLASSPNAGMLCVLFLERLSFISGEMGCCGWMGSETFVAQALDLTVALRQELPAEAVEWALEIGVEHHWGEWPAP